MFLFGLTCSPAGWAGAAGDGDLDEVVITATPYGAPRSIAQVAGVAQSATAATVERSHATDISSFLARRFGSVYVNEIQGNPLQADVNYRGYTASPLLGTPQGLSVYVDGVRLNQPFGDVVSWDLIPRAAIAEITLLSGANPLFGYNSLGGALSLRTKDGLTAPGTTLNGYYGSHERWQIEAETGGRSSNGFDWYVTANQFQEDGWRDSSPSDARQAYGSLGWSDDRNRVVLSVAGAGTDLTGNGLQDVRLLAQDRGSVFTLPDNTQNTSVLANLRATHDLGSGWGISGNAWYRNIDTDTYNGDANEEAMGEDIYQPTPAERAALAAAGYTGYPTSGETQANTPFPFWRCIANALLNSQPDAMCNGLLNRAAISQHNFGTALQVQSDGMWAGRSNQFTAGAVLEHAQSRFTQSSQFAYLTPEHGVMGVDGPGAFADGSQDSPNAFDARVDLAGDVDSQSLFLADTLVLGQVTLSAGLRYDRSQVQNSDAITPEGEPGSLSGTHHFDHLNPGLGLVWKPGGAISLYASANQASRAPSAIELGCADPENPCRLPNSMAGDPPLNQVVTRTMEAGFRGAVSSTLQWSAGAFGADSHDDILFVSDDQAGFGYFRNFGRTRRQGLELSAQGAAGAWSYSVHYTLLDATFRSDEHLAGEGNSSNDGPAPGFEGEIEIEAGDRMPMVPQHIFKSFVQWQVLRRLSLGMEFNFVGESTARGNENGDHAPDDVYYFGSGGTGGYGIWNFSAEWQPSRSLTAYVQVNNLTDHQYSTASLLGSTPFSTSGAYVARPFATPVIDGERPMLHATFVAPGAPRAWLLGLRYRFGGQ